MSTEQTIEQTIEQTTKPVIEERIYIGNVDYKATEDELKELFEGYEVTEVDIPSKSTRRGKKVIDQHLGFAFVQFKTKEEADKAIEEFSGKKFKGRNIYTKKAVPPPTEEEKQKKVEAFKAKQAELKKADAEKKAAKAEAIKAKKAASKEKSESGEPIDGKDKVPEGAASNDTIFITSLDYKADVQTLSNLFKDLKPKWIHVPTVRVPKHVLLRQRKKGRSIYNKGIAFVKFSSEEIQKKAIEEFNGKEINGRKIIVDVAVDTRVPKESSQETESTEESKESEPESK